MDTQLLALLSLHHFNPITISTTPVHPNSIPNTPYSTQPNTPTTTRRPFNSNRRASVAIILRIVPNSQSPSSTTPSSPIHSSLSSQPTDHHSISPNVIPPPSRPYPPSDSSRQIKHFLSQPWVQDGTMQIFFIERANRTSDPWSAHLAFPGGRMELEDEDGLFCAMRETWEEVGIDLAENHFIHLGRLDDREITTSLGKRLLMVLSPYVFLYTRSDGGPTPSLESNEVSNVYWVPLLSLIGPNTKWGEMTIDLSSRLAPSRGPLVRFILRSLVGSMRFRSIILPLNPISPPSKLARELQPHLNLWGLTLGMTLDLLSFFRSDGTPIPSTQLPDIPNLFRSHSLDHLNAPPPEITLVSPSITSIFPRFTHPDINALIWLLGRRYRNLIKKCQQQRNNHDITRTRREGIASETGTPIESRPTTPPTQQQQKLTIHYLNNQMSWTSLTMKEFYRSVRKALILSVLFRIISFSTAFGCLGLFWGPKFTHKIRLKIRFWFGFPPFSLFKK